MNLVSVVLPIKEAQAYIGDILKSLLHQSHQGWELLIIARDGFNYKKHLALEGLDDVRVHQHFMHECVSKSYAYGLENAKGSRVIFMESGERYYSDRLKLSVQMLSDVMVDNFIVVDQGVETEGLPTADTDDGYSLPDYQSALYKPSLIFSKSLAEYIGVDTLLSGDKEVFYEELLRESDEAVLNKEVMYKKFV